MDWSKKGNNRVMDDERFGIMEKMQQEVNVRISAKKYTNDEKLADQRPR